MTYKYWEWLLPVFAVYFFCSCTNGNSTVTDNSQYKNSNLISFKVNGTEVKTTGWNISRFDMGKGINLNVTTNMHEDKRTILFNLNGWKPGTYSLKRGASDPFTGYGDYKPYYSDLLNSYSFESGSFTIESIDTIRGILNASFHGTVKKNDQSFSITDGKIISGQLKSGITKY